MKEKKFQYFYEVSPYKKSYGIVFGLIFIFCGIIIYSKVYMLLFLPVIFAILAFNTLKIMYAKDIKNTKESKLAKKNGKKVKGELLGYKTKSLLEQITGVNSINIEQLDQKIYTLVVKIEDEIFETPTIVYYPEKLFASNECDVYINDDYKYVTNFNLCNDGENYIELSEYIEEENNKTEE